MTQNKHKREKIDAFIEEHKGELFLNRELCKIFHLTSRELGKLVKDRVKRIRVQYENYSELYYEFLW